MVTTTFPVMPVAIGPLIGSYGWPGILIGLGSVYFVFLVASWWRIFAGAGLAGWGALVPIYNVYLMCRCAQRPGWWVLLFFVPGLNLVVWAMVLWDIAKEFGQSEGFAVGLIVLYPIFVPVLAFREAPYGGANGQGTAYLSRSLVR
jgi:hypothetical protein